MFRLQAPAGNSIRKIFASNNTDLDRFFSPYYCQLYGNGTSALAAALKAITEKAEVNHPEIILPAYACPDLISAIEFSGAKPVLSDLESHSVHIDINRLNDKVTPSTVAIIAVNLFGITEKGNALRDFATEHKLALVEDSAQYFPGVINEESWFGDYIILSFGRGKPASILGGGAVLTKSEALFKTLPDIPAGQISKLKYAVKACLYNILIQPFFYYWLNKMPGMQLGATVYKPLASLAAFNANTLGVLQNTLKRFQQSKRDSVQQYEQVLCEYEFLDDIFARQSTRSETLPLRYPVLAKTSKLRDEVFTTLQNHGIGVSKMYQSALNQIGGMEHVLPGSERFQKAEDFAGRLFTLPTHNRISKKDITLLKKALDSINY